MFFGGLTSRNACSFLGDGFMPSPETMCPNSSIFDTKKLHFDSFRVMPAFLNRLRTSTNDFKSHLRSLVEVLSRFRKAGITLKLSKCNFFVSKMELLGHIVSGEGIKPSPKKLQALRDVKPPKNIRELRGYLGMTTLRSCQNRSVRWR